MCAERGKPCKFSPFAGFFEFSPPKNGSHVRMPKKIGATFPRSVFLVFVLPSAETRITFSAFWRSRRRTWRCKIFHFPKLNRVFGIGVIFFSFFTLVLPLRDACMCVCVWRLILNLYVRLWACSVWVTRAGCWRCRRDRLVRAKTFPCGRSYRHSLVNKLFEELPDINAFRDVTCADFWSAVAIGFLFIILLF